MKQLILAIMLVTIPSIYIAQESKSEKTKASYLSYNEKYVEEEIVEIFIEIEIEEYYQKKALKITVNSGKIYSSMLSEKPDIIMVNNLQKEVDKMYSIPDLLNYLSDKGFSIVHYSTLNMNDFILNKIIVSQYFIGVE
jgi:hypothetical protein